MTSLDPAEFDRFRDSYETELNRAVGFAGQDADVYMQVKANTIVAIARERLGDAATLDVLDVGCGIGATAQHLVPEVGSFTGVDISAAMIERASAAVPEAQFLSYDGSTLPADDASYDVTFAICVLHHVPPTGWDRFVAEMSRVTRSRGLVVIAEHNPFNPVTRAIVNRCAFDVDVTLLSPRVTRRLLVDAGLRDVETRNILFVPWRNGAVDRIEGLLRRVPLGAQHVAVAQKP